MLNPLFLLQKSKTRSILSLDNQIVKYKKKHFFLYLNVKKKCFEKGIEKMIMFVGQKTKKL